MYRLLLLAVVIPTLEHCSEVWEAAQDIDCCIGVSNVGRS